MSLIFGFIFALGLVFLCVSLKRNKLAHKVLVYIHDSGIIIEVSAIVFGAENGHKLLVLSKESVAILHDLMASANQVKVEFLQKLLKLLSSENKSTASLVLFPVTGIFFRVIPEEVSNESAIWYISGLRDMLYLLEAMHVFRDTTVHTHDLLIDKGYQRHVVEAIPECLPEINSIPSLNFIEKSIDSGDSL